MSNHNILGAHKLVGLPFKVGLCVQGICRPLKFVYHYNPQQEVENAVCFYQH